MQGLKVELVLRLLAYDAQVGPQCGLCDRLGAATVSWTRYKRVGRRLDAQPPGKRRR